jgi:hypothetical protein
MIGDCIINNNASVVSKRPILCSFIWIFCHVPGIHIYLNIINTCVVHLWVCLAQIAHNPSGEIVHRSGECMSHLYNPMCLRKLLSIAVHYRFF